MLNYDRKRDTKLKRKTIKTSILKLKKLKVKFKNYRYIINYSTYGAFMIYNDSSLIIIKKHKCTKEINIKIFDHMI